MGGTTGCVGGGGTNVKQAKLRFDEAFRVVLNGRNGQVAEMVLAPGGSEGGPENRHRGADQWLFVVAGTGEADVGGVCLGLGEGSLVLIERGERHEIRNTGSQPLRTLNFYTPAAFDHDGDPLPAGET
jgi:mannose-6-phosphate isomerase-like protein (cupin superfamily)